MNVEDDAIEQRRRLSAILRQMGKVPADLRGRFIRVGPRGVGTLIERDPSTGRTYATPAMERINDLIEEHKPDLVVFDPLVELHNSEENDNGALRAVMAAFRSLAVQHNIAIVLVHHSRKGTSAIAGDADTLRGASSIVGAARIVITATGMTKDEATDFGFAANQARHYFRIDGAKANYSETGNVEWFERHGFELDNGEIVVAVVPWTPPRAAVTDDVVAAILIDIGKGSADGPWSPQLGSGLRSIRQLFVRHGITATTQQTKLLAELTGSRGVTVEAVKGADRKPTKGLRTAEGLPAAAPWITTGV
jgi:hypothetical protein